MNLNCGLKLEFLVPPTTLADFQAKIIMKSAVMFPDAYEAATCVNLTAFHYE